MDRTLYLPNVRLAFPVFGEPEDYNSNGKFRWAAVGLVKKDSDLHKKIMAKMLEVAMDKWAGGKKGKAGAQAIFDDIMSDKKATCYVDGDKKADYDGFEGNFALSAYRYVNDGRPVIIDKDKSPIYKPDNTLYEGKAGRLYAGMYVNMQVEFWAQENSNGKGLRCTLQIVQPFKDGDSFGGAARVTNTDAFGEVAEGTEDEESLS